MIPKYSIGQKVMNINGTDMGAVTEVLITSTTVSYRWREHGTWVEEAYLCFPTEQRIKRNQLRDLRCNIKSQRMAIKHFVRSIKEMLHRVKEDERALALLENK